MTQWPLYNRTKITHCKQNWHCYTYHVESVPCREAVPMSNVRVSKVREADRRVSPCFATNDTRSGSVSSPALFETIPVKLSH